jgi:predicted amidohydrolase
MKVAGVQHDIAWEDRDANFARLGPMIGRAAADGARLVVLTEMYATGFSMKTDRIAEPVDGPSARFLADQARAHGVWVCATVPERPDASELPFNQLVLAAPDGVTHRYAKIHPFTYGNEHRHYAAGDRFLTVDIDGTRCAFFVCYDLRFADEFWALAQQTDCYVLPANWPASRREHWMTLLRARAIENQAFVMAANQHSDPGGYGLPRFGHSMIIDPWGTVIAQAGPTGDGVIVAELDLAAQRATRSTLPALDHRRPDAYTVADTASGSLSHPR